MNKIFILLIIVILLGCGHAFKITSDNKALLKTHKTVAILPVEIYFGNKMPINDKLPETEILPLKRYMSVAIQEELYKTLKAKQKRFPFTVTVQPAEITNNILSSKNISFAAVFGNNKNEICKILGVDAIISWQLTLGKEEKSSANDVKNKGSLESVFSVYDSTVIGTPVWNYNKVLTDNLGDELLSSSYYHKHELYYKAETKYQAVIIPWVLKIEESMNLFASYFPYKKK